MFCFAFDNVASFVSKKVFYSVHHRSTVPEGMPDGERGFDTGNGGDDADAEGAKYYVRRHVLVLLHHFPPLSAVFDSFSKPDVSHSFFWR